MKNSRIITIRLDRKNQGAFEITPEGYLVCEAFATRSGVFDYYDDDGKLTREWRPPEEVFADESLSTLAMQPITFLHPKSEAVTTDNIRGLQVGVTGENISHDGEVVKCRVKITDRSVIEYVKARHAQGEGVDLSCGYGADVVPISGEHPREGHYDAVQKNIRYNHLAIVPRGRAGEKVRLKLDGKRHMRQFIFNPTEFLSDTFKNDIIESNVPKEALGIFTFLNTKLTEAVDLMNEQSTKINDLTQKLDVDQAKIDTLDATNKKLRSDFAALTSPGRKLFGTIIANRTALEAIAAKMGIIVDGLNNRAVKVAVIQTQFPKFMADEKSNDDINARYDFAVEQIKAIQKAKANQDLARVIADAKKAGLQPHFDHREEFIRKSHALANCD